MRITDYAFVEVGEREINENLRSKIDRMGSDVNSGHQTLHATSNPA